MSLLSKRSIVIELDKMSFYPGEEISGTMKLTTDEPIKADKITIGLQRESNRRQTSVNSNGISNRSEHEYNFLFDVNLGGQGEYESQDIPFKFIIPENVIPEEVGFESILNKIPESFRGIAGMLIETFLGLKKVRYSFNIIARVDIPWGIDLTEKIPVHIEQK